MNHGPEENAPAESGPGEGGPGEGGNEVTPPEVMPQIAAELFGEQLPLLQRFHDLLYAEGQIRGLVGPREMGRLWSRHIINCAPILKFLPRNINVADVGSGAGLPGLVIACARPDLGVVLIDSMQRRCEWLEYAAQELGLENVQVFWGRAEELKAEPKFEVVTARAVAHLSKLLPWCRNLCARNGKFVFLKGEKVAEELADAKAKNVLVKAKVKSAKIHEFHPEGTGEPTYLLELRK